MADNVWASLSLYESVELLKRFTQEKSRRKLNNSKAREIAAHFSQGREYFRSAAGAGDLVRPLILYYGALSLARGAALFLQDGKSKVKGQHGLKTGGWGDLLSEPAAVPSCTVRIEPGGTFGELADVTRNSEVARVVHAGVPSVVEVRSPAGIPPAGTELTIKEILGQIPDVAGLYERTFGEHPGRLRCEVQMTYELEPGTRAIDEQIPPGREVRRHAYVGVVPGALGPADEEWVAETVCGGSLRLYESNTFLPFARDPANEVAGASLFELYFDAGSEARPGLEMPVAADGTGDEYLKLSTGAGITLSTLLALHLTAYAAGMLVRYHPGYWATLSGGSGGDSIGPILSAAVSTVEERYPALILEALGGG